MPENKNKETLLKRWREGENGILKKKKMRAPSMDYKLTKLLHQ